MCYVLVPIHLHYDENAFESSQSLVDYSLV